jgi:hypothetical protein
MLVLAKISDNVGKKQYTGNGILVGFERRKRNAFA